MHLRRWLQDRVISGISIACQNLWAVQLQLTQLPIILRVALTLLQRPKLNGASLNRIGVKTASGRRVGRIKAHYRFFANEISQW